MSPQDAQSIANLEARYRDCHAAMCLTRELLIEALGDLMCGSGAGPSSQMIWAFEEAGFLEAMARHELKTLRDNVESRWIDLPDKSAITHSGY